MTGLVGLALVVGIGLYVRNNTDHRRTGTAIMTAAFPPLLVLYLPYALYDWHRNRGKEGGVAGTLGIAPSPVSSDHPAEERRSPTPREPLADEPEGPPIARDASPYRSPSAETRHTPTEHSTLTDTLTEMVHEDSVEKMRHAAIAGGISALVTFLVVIAAISGSNAFDALAIDFWALLDVALMVGVSYGVYRGSRVAAVVLFVYFVYSKVYVWVAMGNVSGLPVALVFGYFYFQGIRGAFAYHRLASPPPIPSRPLVTAFVGVSFLLVMGGFSFAFYSALLSDARVEADDESYGRAQVAFYGWMNGRRGEFQVQIVDVIEGEWREIALLDVHELDCDFELAGELEEHLVTILFPDESSPDTRLIMNPEESEAGGEARTCTVVSGEVASN